MELKKNESGSHTPSFPPRRVLVTGAAGFIAGHLSEFLLRQHMEVVGIDSLNHYYDRRLKIQTLKILQETSKSAGTYFKFHQIDLRNRRELEQIFEKDGPFDCIVHLAAQAGVRYSLQHPQDCVENNVVGSLNMLECSRIYYPRSHFVMASSSSVYGCDSPSPFDERTAACNRPLSVYAASKKSAEMLAQSYHLVYKLPITLFRFFTVYGPRGRPDMAVYKFIEALVDDSELPLFGDGSALREFTFISDIIAGIMTSINKGPSTELEVFNIGGGSVHTIMDLINTIESAVGKKARLSFQPEQLGDVPMTTACQEHIRNQLGFQPKVSLASGIRQTVEWYMNWNDIKHSMKDDSIVS